MSEIITERLILRRPQASDLDALYALTNDDEMQRFLGSASPSLSFSFTRLLQNAGSWSFYGYGSFIVIEKANNRMIGNCGVFHSYRGLGDDVDDKPEAGWIIARDHWGQGYAREAMDAALTWFDSEHGKQPIMAMIQTGNITSVALANALGFTFTRMAMLEQSEMQLFQRA